MEAYLEAEDLRLDQRQGTAVDLDETTASLDDESNVSTSAYIFMILKFIPCRQKSKRIFA